MRQVTSSTLGGKKTNPLKVNDFGIRTVDMLPSRSNGALRDCARALRVTVNGLVTNGSPGISYCIASILFGCNNYVKM